MKNLTSRQKILLGVPAMILCMVGDYLLGFGTIGTASGPDALYGMMWNAAPRLEIRMVAAGLLPVKKAAVICCPVITAVLGQAANLIAGGSIPALSPWDGC